ncbi:hypothetical protein G6F68_017653 [Rhizopus microsporus]|nr:hypothetical protein G6F68_017653 [Rhizopus microsporus]
MSQVKSYRDIEKLICHLKGPAVPPTEKKRFSKPPIDNMPLWRIAPSKNFGVYDPYLTQKSKFWVKYGSNMGQIWVNSGSNMGQYGLNMGQFWVKYGSIWVKYGSIMGQLWVNMG